MRLPVLAFVPAGLLLLAGCSSPASRFYTLSPVAVPATVSSDISVSVGPVSIPAMVDLPAIVVSKGPNQVELDEFNRWAAPLSDNIAQVVAENLAALLGTQRVTLFKQPLGAAADYRVAVEIQSFLSAPGDAATLNAVWLVRRAKDGASRTGRTSLREPTNGPGYEALAAAHSRALASLSQDIAGGIRGLEQSQP